MMNVLKSIHKESLIFTARSDLCVCAFEMLSNSLSCPGSALCMRKAAQRCVWSDSLNLLQLSSSAMPSFAPPECVMNGATESHNDHILNRPGTGKVLGFLCCLLYESWITYRVGGRRRDMMVEMLIWMSFCDWAILELKRMQHHLGGFGPAKIIVFIPQSFRVFF